LPCAVCQPVSACNTACVCLRAFLLQAICEEIGDNGDSSKQRDFVALVTPENPQYLFNFAESTSDVDIEAPSICGETGGG
jgi:hypothetical protein